MKKILTNKELAVINGGAATNNTATSTKEFSKTSLIITTVTTVAITLASVMLCGRAVGKYILQQNNPKLNFFGEIVDTIITGGIGKKLGSSSQPIDG